MATYTIEEMTEETRETLNRAQRLVRAATGENYGDGEMVTDIGIGMVRESDQTVWVSGNWNPSRFLREGDEPLTNTENLPERLGNALEGIGVETLWSDEWQRCIECARAIRTEPNSYSWTADYINTEDGLICSDDADFSDIEEEAVNNHRYAVPTWFDLVAEGFERFNGVFENGWDEGQTDDPEEILERAHSEFSEGVFQISSVGQFDIRFTLYVRDPYDSDHTAEELLDIDEIEGWRALIDSAESDGSHYFDTDSTRFFDGRYHELPKETDAGWLFIDSVQNGSAPRIYRVQIYRGGRYGVDTLGSWSRESAEYMTPSLTVDGEPLEMARQFMQTEYLLANKGEDTNR